MLEKFVAIFTNHKMFQLERNRGNDKLRRFFPFWSPVRALAGGAQIPQREILPPLFGGKFEKSAVRMGFIDGNGMNKRLEASSAASQKRVGKRKNGWLTSEENGDKINVTMTEKEGTAWTRALAVVARQAEVAGRPGLWWALRNTSPV